MLESAQRNELRTLVESVKDILEENYRKKLSDLGIQAATEDLIPLDELIDFEMLDDPLEKAQFTTMRDQIYATIKQESKVIEEGWDQGYFWYVDKCVYSFFNRVFAVRIMEELDLLTESTLIPQADLGNRSARMAKMQEQHPQQTDQWWKLLLQDVFAELNEEIKVIFDPQDPALNIFPDDAVILQVVHQCNALNFEIYKAEDCIGWFYHYYVVKFRKSHKTMSSHGSKSPKNPYYLSILNTVYTPRWMVRILVDNSLGHWWHNHQPDSQLFFDSPYYIQKQPNDLRLATEKLEDLRLLDPACGSGNFLVYAFSMLVKMYQERSPTKKIAAIVEIILRQNLYGVDINRRPAQLSVLALFILAKRTINEHDPSQLHSFKMPAVNIICCDIRLPNSRLKDRYLQHATPQQQNILKDLFAVFDNADQLGSLIDVSALQEKLQELPSEKQMTLDQFKTKEQPVSIRSVSKIIENVMDTNKQNLGVHMFGEETKHALSLAKILLQKYDIVFGNPPFGLAMDQVKNQLKKDYPITYGDLISTFVDQGLRLLKENGYLGYVTDFSFLHLPKFEKFRSKILLKKSTIDFILMIGYGALPNAGNRPLIFGIRKINEEKTYRGLFRSPNYDINKGFNEDFYITEITNDIAALNSAPDLAPQWNRIAQNVFLSLPRSVIDLTIEEKFEPLLAFFEKYPRLDFSQHTKEEKELIRHKTQISRAYQGFATGNNDIFVRFWYEVPVSMIRTYKTINDIEDIGEHSDDPFVPYSKGYGDLQYYVSNCFILWWNQKSLEKISETGGVLRNIPLQGVSTIKWSLSSGKPRGRFTLSQPGVISDVVSMSIKIDNEKISPNNLLGYLNSKLIVFFGRLQTKDRKWQAGNVARIPIPIDFLSKNNEISDLARESVFLRKMWDTNLPHSPIFSLSLLDKILCYEKEIDELYVSKTSHPFKFKFNPLESKISNEFRKNFVDPTKITIKELLNLALVLFNLITSRLDEIDKNIDENLFKLLNNSTRCALEEYSCRFVGKMKYVPEHKIWLKDFLMANLMEIIKQSPNGITCFYKQSENEEGLYSKFIQLLCMKFVRTEAELQPLLLELEQQDFLGKSLENWILEDFFFYHCQRFGGRPIIWQFTSKMDARSNGALNIFIDYHQLTKNTLPNIRVNIIQPLLTRLEHQRDTAILPDNEKYKIPELEQFLTAFLEIEKGYTKFPTPNQLTGNKAAKGKGDDKTWEWVFGEAAKIIQNGYNPDMFMGVLVNLIPLSLAIPEKNQDKVDLQYRSITPKGTMKAILKKLSALDQLKQKSAKSDSEDNDDEDEDEEEG